MGRIKLRKPSKKKKSNLIKKVPRKKIKLRNGKKESKLKKPRIKKRKRPVTLNLTYGNIEVKGSYEYRACEILDKMITEGTLTSWEYEKISIPYIGKDGKRHLYIVDFLLNENGKRRLLEVKGRETELDRIKWAAAKRNGWDLTIWRKDDIFADINYKDYLKQFK